jgi:hypothetical protein
MTKARWLAIAAIAGGVSYTAKGCLNRPAPDQKLAGQLEDLCEIARTGAEKPVAGVKKLGRYMIQHGGDLAKNAVDMIALIERIPDDDAHDERAIIARDRLHEVSCKDDWDRFNRAIDGDPDAMALIQDAMTRLNATLEIILGPRMRLRDLPARIEGLVPVTR